MATLTIEDNMWKEILAYSFVVPIVFASYFGKVPGLVFSIISSIVSGSQAIDEFLIFSPFAQRIMFQILFINVVALVTTSLSEREKRTRISLQQLFNNMPIGLFRIDSEGNLLEINDTMVKMLAIDKKEKLSSYNLKDFFINNYEFLGLFGNKDTGVKNSEVMLERKDGKLIWVNIICRLKEIDDVAYTIREYEGSFEDITDRVTLFQEVKNLATYDSLTGVFNRGYFISVTEPIFKEALIKNNPLAMLLLDVDYFKKVNDTYGHPVGDIVLQEIARCIVENASESGIVGRYGGDEFVLFLLEKDYESALKISKAIREGVKLLDINVKGQKVNVSVSVGISSLDFNNDNNIDDLVRRADISMYNAKNIDRNKPIS
jgi:diguanylate cyclase (GGDEF)-like protein/PAS domain S-box-containing protein